MPMKTEQRTTRRMQGGKLISETKGGELSESASAVDASTEKARRAMVVGAKPKVSTDEPKDKNSIQWLAWKRRQKRSASDGAAALASR